MWFEIDDGVCSCRSARGIVVQVFDQTLHRHVRNAGDQIEMIPVHVAVEHGAHFAARFDHFAKLLALSDATDVRKFFEPAIAGDNNVVTVIPGAETNALRLEVKAVPMKQVTQWDIAHLINEAVGWKWVRHTSRGST